MGQARRIKEFCLACSSDGNAFGADRRALEVRYGGGIVKKRVALPRRGKSGSTRTLIATNMGTRWYFVFGFEKNERDNIAADELAALKRLATDLSKLTDPQISTSLFAGTLSEISGDES